MALWLVSKKDLSIDQNLYLAFCLCEHKLLVRAPGLRCDLPVFGSPHSAALSLLRSEFLLKRILQNCSDGKLLSCLVLKLVQMENFSQSLFLKIVQMDRHLGFLDVPQPSDPDVKVFHKHCITSNAKQHLKPP